MADTTNNGRVTLAVLKNDIVHLMTQIAALAAAVTAVTAELHGVCMRYDERLGKLEAWRESRDTRWADHEKEHERESIVLKAWTLVGSTIAAVVASIVGIFVQKP